MIVRCVVTPPEDRDVAYCNVIYPRRASVHVRAELKRGRVVYARASSSDGRLRFHARHRLRGRYTLVLRMRHGSSTAIRILLR
jgi:hypothetical protein